MIGTCLVSQVDGKPRIDRADKVIQISLDMLDEVGDGRAGGKWCSVEGNLFTIQATNRTVVYELGELTADGFARTALRRDA